MLVAAHTWCRIEVHTTDDEPPFRKPVLKVFDCTDSGQPQIAEITLSNFCGFAQVLFEQELAKNLGHDPNSREYRRRLKALRKALGYSYP
jgi:hypothetical protein